ncbi:MAG TPA: hypothetical protein VNW04_22650 [Puia sp.]|jgi:hypothetical protein|nr:hypothetical protein [Puia sp.]
MSTPKVAFGAILTADIVNSTKLLPQQQERLVKALGFFLADHIPVYKHKHQYEFYRGDSFQVYIKNPDEALRTALACRGLAIGITEEGDEETGVLSDIRISIGIGTIDGPITSLGIAKGEAFLLSGRQFDELQKTDQRLTISCGQPIANVGFKVMADYLDSIYSRMTTKQANLIVTLLQGITQQQAAITLNKSKSTISQLANAGRWPEIEKVLKQYEQLINLIQ